VSSGSGDFELSDVVKLRGRPSPERATLSGLSRG
jgi:hypothetical protein